MKGRQETEAKADKGGMVHSVYEAHGKYEMETGTPMNMLNDTVH